MEHKKINYYKEKRWIMAWWYKRRKELQFTDVDMLFQWNQWWKSDFTDSADEAFQNVYHWVKHTVNTMSMEQIKKGRYAVVVNKPIPKAIQDMAISKGYYIKKSSASKHPLTVSGYAIFKHKRSKEPVYGCKHELTMRQVIEFLEKETN